MNIKWHPSLEKNEIIELEIKSIQAWEKMNPSLHPKDETSFKRRNA